ASVHTGRNACGLCQGLWGQRARQQPHIDNDADGVPPPYRSPGHVPGWGRTPGLVSSSGTLGSANGRVIVTVCTMDANRADPRASVVVAAAERLRAAARDRVPCAPLRDLIAPDDVATAYAVQEAVCELRLGD